MGKSVVVDSVLILERETIASEASNPWILCSNDLGKNFFNHR
jgi:hypothetical protein